MQLLHTAHSTGHPKESKITANKTCNPTLITVSGQCPFLTACKTVHRRSNPTVPTTHTFLRIDSVSAAAALVARPAHVPRTRLTVDAGQCPAERLPCARSCCAWPARRPRGGTNRPHGTRATTLTFRTPWETLLGTDNQAGLLPNAKKSNSPKCGETPSCRRSALTKHCLWNANGPIGSSAAFKCVWRRANKSNSKLRAIAPGSNPPKSVQDGP